MKVRRILGGLVMLMAAVLVAGTVTLVNLDVENYRETIQAQAEAATGRPLAIKGPLDLRLSFAPAVTAETVSLGNAPWGSRPEMMTIKRLELEIDLVPLFYGDFHFKRLLLVEPDIVLENDDQGRGNWDFGVSGKTEQGVAPERPYLHFEEIMILGGGVIYRDARTGETISVSIDHLEGRTEGPLDPLQLAFEGRYNQVPLSIDGVIGSFAQLRTGPFPLDIKAEVAGAAFEVEGNVSDPVGSPGIDLQVIAKGDELAEIGELAGVELPPIGPYDVLLRLTGAADTLEISGLVAQVEKLSATGTATILLEQQGPRVENADLRVTTRGKDVRELAALAEVEAPALGAYDIALDLKVSGNTVQISDLKAKVGESTGSGTASIALEDGSIAVAGLDLAIATRGESLADLGTLAGRELPALGAYTVWFNLKGAGQTFALTDVDAKVGDSSVAGTVEVTLTDGGLRVEDFDLQVATRGESLSDLVGFAVEVPLDLGPFEFASHLNRDGESVKLAHLRVKVGGSDVAGNAVVSLEGDRPSITGTFAAERLDLRDLGRLPEKANQPKRRRSAEGDQAKERYLFTDEPLPFDALRAVDLDVSLEAGTLRLDEETILSNVDIRAVLRDGHLGATPVRVELYGGKLEATADLNATQTPPTVGVLLDVRGLDYGRLLKSRGVTSNVTGAMDLDVKIRGTGQSMRAIMSSLDGRLDLVSNQGIIDENLLKFLALGLNSIVGPLFGSADSGNLRCAVTRFNVENGLATSEAILVVMEDVAISGGGTIDLRTESLDLAFRTETSKINLSRFAGPFAVKGTLAQPSAGLDAMGTAFGLAKAAGMVFFPVTGLQLLTSQMALETVAGENPCVTALTKTSLDEGDKKGIIRSVTEDTAKAAKGTAERATGVVTDIVKGVRSGLKSLSAD